MRYAQILNNRIHWILESEETIKKLRSRFAPDLVFVVVGAEVQEGWVWDGKKAIAPEPVDPMPEIRSERNRLLLASDWTQLPDAPLSDTQKAAWLTYRQQLRDFPETCDPLNPVWPIPPI